MNYITNVGIYKITNIKNNKVYIGQSVKLSARKNGHINSLKKQQHHNPLLQLAFNKYGQKSFVFEILEECEIDQLDEKERFWISFFDSTNRDYGYNFESGGNLKKRAHPETVEKIRIANRGTGNTLTEEEVREIKIAIHLGINQTDLAEIFNATVSNINKIAKGHNWGWVLPEFNNSQENKISESKETRIKRVLELFEEGHNVPAISRLTPYTEAEVQNVVNGKTTEAIKSKYNNIKIDYENGMSREKLAEKYNMKLCSINRVLPNAPAEEFELRNSRVIEMHRQGYKNIEIANELNIHRTTVTDILKGRVKMVIRKPVTLTNELEIQILNMIKAGSSRREVSNKLEISRYTVNKVIYKFGVEVIEKRRDITGRKHHAARSVVKLDVKGHFIKSYELIKDAATSIGVGHTNIIACCTGKTKTSGGYKWMYLEEYEKLKSAN